jgi:hypothetical protein
VRVQPMCSRKGLVAVRARYFLGLQQRADAGLWRGQWRGRGGALGLTEWSLSARSQRGLVRMQVADVSRQPLWGGKGFAAVRARAFLVWLPDGGLHESFIYCCRSTTVSLICS